MQTRTSARKRALQVLFQVDVGRHPADDILQEELGKVRKRFLSPVQSAIAAARNEIQAAMQDPKISGTENRRILRREGREIDLTLEVLSAKLAEEIAAATDIDQSPPPELEKAAARRASEAREKIRGALLRLDPFPDLTGRIARVTEDRLEEAAAAFIAGAEPARRIARFLVTLVQGTLKHRDEIDRKLAEVAASWDVARQPAADRNVMRMAAYEILFLRDSPTPTVIAEAVHIARRYSTAESGRFVNGVLAALAERESRRGPEALTIAGE